MLSIHNCLQMCRSSCSILKRSHLLYRSYGFLYTGRTRPHMCSRAINIHAPHRHESRNFSANVDSDISAPDYFDDENSDMICKLLTGLFGSNFMMWNCVAISTVSGYTNLFGLVDTTGYYYWIPFGGTAISGILASFGYLFSTHCVHRCYVNKPAKRVGFELCNMFGYKGHSVEVPIGTLVLCDNESFSSILPVKSLNMTIIDVKSWNKRVIICDRKKLMRNSKLLEVLKRTECVLDSPSASAKGRTHKSTARHRRGYKNVA